MADKGSRKLSFIVIGAGVSGILMGIKLRERGYRDFVILEKAETLGGTWRDNIYPGIACDVAAHLYVYSFATNPGWRTRFAAGPDIWTYYHRIARRYGVLPHIRYNKEVASAEWDGSGWRVETRDGEIFTADVVIGATGLLHHPVMPDIPGADRFTGPKFHTARWDRSVDVRGKRLGLIGTGSTATQIVAALADEVGQLKLFQRTPQWVMPIPNDPIPLWQRLAFRLSPAYARRHYRRLRDFIDTRAKSTIGSSEARAERDRQCLRALESVRDPELRQKLTPQYDVGCKRLVISGTFYEAVQKPSVEVITEGIDHIAETSVVTRDGRRHEIDILVFATGFDAHAYLRPMSVRGAGGVTLDDVWGEVPLTYRSVAIPHMPNFLLINGPYSPAGTISIVGIVEAQVAYLMKLIDHIEEKDVAIAPTEAASRAWLDDVRERARQTVWATGGCQSWYLDKSGTPTIDPCTLDQLESGLADVRLTDFDEQPRAVARGRAAEAA